MIRVAFAIPTLDKNGPDGVFYQLLCRLDRARFAPSLIIQKDDGHFLRQLPGDVAVQVVGNRRTTGVGYPVSAMRRLLRGPQRPDIVISTLRMTLTVGAALFGQRDRPVHLLRPANHLSENSRTLMRRAPLKHSLSLAATVAALRACDGLVCQSRSLQQDLRRYVGARQHSVVIGNPVDVDKLESLASIETHHVLAGSPALLSVGRLSAQKGFDLLIDALPAIVQKHPGAHLTLLGEGPDRAALQTRAQQLGVDGHLTLGGFVSNPYPQMRACDLFVSSSRYEGFPNAVLEAIALGRPVVATNCPGGTEELIIPNQTGWLAPPENATALATVIMSALAARKASEPAALRQLCRQHFSGDAIARQYETAIMQALGRRKDAQLRDAKPDRRSA